MLQSIYISGIHVRIRSVAFPENCESCIAAEQFVEKRVDNPNSHGTGCTLSSAIASGLAKGQSLEQAVDNGKKYVTACLKAMLDMGHGSGPMNHGALILQ